MSGSGSKQAAPPFSVPTAVRRSVIALFAMTCLTPGSASAADPGADNLHDLFAGLRRCLRPIPAPAGSQLTIRFSLKRDGSLLGRAKITFAALPKDAAARQDFVAGVAAALGRCLPIHVTAGLGGAIAGRPLTLRFVVQAPSTDT